MWGKTGLGEMGKGRFNTYNLPVQSKMGEGKKTGLRKGRIKGEKRLREGEVGNSWRSLQVDEQSKQRWEKGGGN